MTPLLFCITIIYQNISISGNKHQKLIFLYTWCQLHVRPLEKGELQIRPLLQTKKLQHLAFQENRNGILHIINLSSMHLYNNKLDISYKNIRYDACSND